MIAHRQFQKTAHSRGQILPPVLQSNIVHLANSGCSIKMIAARLELSRNTVRKYVRSQNMLSADSVLVMVPPNPPVASISPASTPVV